MDDRAEAQINHLPAFGPATMVMTTQGEVPVEWLATGHRVITRDHGAQPILWLGRVRVRGSDLIRAPLLGPLEIAKGALGPERPNHPLLLSRAHRVLVEGPLVELNLGTGEALAQIDDLADGDFVREPARRGLLYTQILLPHHALVQANGIWVESLHLDRTALVLLDHVLPRRLLMDTVLRVHHSYAARPCLERWEVVAMHGRVPGRVPDMIAGVA